MAGLVGGDSDSSALTQESGDEGAGAGTPRGSVMTGTDAGTEYAEDEDVEMLEPSVGMYFWPAFPRVLTSLTRLYSSFRVSKTTAR